MPVEKVQLGVSAIKELLDNGYTWLKKDDLGFGSIQEKYQASEVQINTIRKHPALKDLETTARVFIIVDDRLNEATTTLSAVKSEHEESLGILSRAKSSNSGNGTGVFEGSDETLEAVSDTDSFSAFNNL